MSKRVLIIDDEIQTLRALRLGLIRDGFDVETAREGKEGLEKVRSHQPKVVVLDLSMPGMDGFSFLKAMRRQKSTRDIPVIVLTGLNPSNTLLESYDRGADLFLTKPVDIRKLADAISGYF